MTNPFRLLFGWLGKLFRAAPHVAEAIQKVLIQALPVVEMIAAMTPTQADDEIIALAERFWIKNVKHYLDLPVGERGPALLAAATNALKKQFPAITTVQIQAAIQLALAMQREPAMATDAATIAVLATPPVPGDSN